MSNVLFSIVIPVYNAEQYLVECVNSVLSQNQSEFELILIDDGSTDNSSRICDELSFIYDKIIVIHKINGGVSEARKIGVEKARGDYIICVDADDWLNQGLLSEAKRIILKYHPDVLIYGLKREDAKGNWINEIPYRTGLYTKDDLEAEIFPILIQSEDANYFIPSLWGKIIKRSLLLENLLVNKYAVIGEDGACVIPCIAQARSMWVMEKCYYNYRYNSESATKKKKSFPWKCPQIINMHIISRIDIDAFDFHDQMYRKIVHDFFNVVISQFYSQKKYRETKKEIIKQMQEDFYKISIEKAVFKKSLKAWVMIEVLRKKLIFIIYLYAKLRKNG